MKKIIIVFIFLISSLTFFLLYNSYDFIISEDIKRGETYLSDVNDNINFVDIYTDNTYDDSLILQNVLESAKQLDTSVVLFDKEKVDNGNSNFNIYLYSPDNAFYERINLKNDYFIDFSKDDSLSYYSTDSKDTNKSDQLISFSERNFLKSGSISKVKPFSQAITNRNSLRAQLSFYIENGADKVSILENLDVMVKAENINIRINDLTGALEYQSNSEYLSGISKEIFACAAICFLIILLAICCHVSKKSREVVIRKMHGQRSFSIILELYATFFVQIIFTYWFAFFILWLFLIRNFHSMFYDFYIDFTKISGIYILFLLVVYVLVYLYIEFTCNLSYLKKERNTKVLLKLNYVTKVVVSCLLVLPVLNSVYSSIPLLKDYFLVRDNEEQIRNQYLLGDIQGVQKENLHKMLLEDTLYSDFRTYSDNYGFADRNEGEWPQEVLDNMDIKHPYIIANGNYIKDNQILDVKGNPINMNDLNNNSLLIPEQYNVINTIPYCIFENCEVIKTKNTGTYVNSQINQPVRVLNNPIILLVKESSSYVDNGGFTLPRDKVRDMEYYQDKIREVMKNDKQYNLIPNDAKYDRYLDTTRQALFEMLFIFLITVTIFFLFLYQSLYLYFHSNKKEIMIRYLQGNSRLLRYGDLFMLNGIVYGIVTMCSLLLLKIGLHDILSFVLILALFDSVIQFLFIYRFERNNITTVLKGEDIYE